MAKLNFSLIFFAETVMLFCCCCCQGSYAVWKSMEFDLNNFQVWKSMEKRKQNMETYLHFQTLVFFIIENYKLNENDLARSVFSWQLFSPSLVTVKHDWMNSRCTSFIMQKYRLYCSFFLRIFLAPYYRAFKSTFAKIKNIQLFLCAWYTIKVGILDSAHWSIYCTISPFCVWFGCHREDYALKQT